MMEYLKLDAGCRTALMDGTMVPDSPGHMATRRFYHALSGSRLRILNISLHMLINEKKTGVHTHKT